MALRKPSSLFAGFKKSVKEKFRFLYEKFDRFIERNQYILDKIAAFVIATLFGGVIAIAVAAIVRYCLFLVTVDMSNLAVYITFGVLTAGISFLLFQLIDFIGKATIDTDRSYD